ncbi:hypothetical protein SSS_03846 [Sarcoptes scabiei]|nr:hypothetical protein SSS_03846 [Sarcoptes scabiei]
MENFLITFAFNSHDIINHLANGHSTNFDSINDCMNNKLDFNYHLMTRDLAIRSCPEQTKNDRRRLLKNRSQTSDSKGKFTRTNNSYDGNSFGLQTSLYCNFCDTNVDLFNLVTHTIKHLCEKNFLDDTLCLHCCRIFLTPSQMKRHCESFYKDIDEDKTILNETGCSETAPYLCQFCNFTFKTRNLLFFHSDSEHREAFCPYCHTSFDIHLYITQDMNESDRCQYQAAIKNMRCHLEHHLILKDTFKCKLCLCVFLSEEELAFHVFTHKALQNGNGENISSPDKI